MTKDQLKKFIVELGEENRRLSEKNKIYSNALVQEKEEKKKLKENITWHKKEELRLCEENKKLKEDNRFLTKVCKEYMEKENIVEVAEFTELYKDDLEKENNKLKEEIRFLEQCLDNKEKVNKSLREDLKIWKLTAKDYAKQCGVDLDNDLNI